MSVTDKKDLRVILALAGIFGAAMLMMWATLPLLPVDETRYLSVAWGMRDHGNWLLPMINAEPYSHKPPLLFWLVNLAWTVGGLNIGAARTIPLLTTLCVLLLTYALARRLYPERKAVPLLAVTLLLAMPAFMLYGALIMFDMLITLWILATLFFIWRAAKEQEMRYWLLAGVMLGIGLLAKGPVVVMHVAFPALLLPWWKPEGFSWSYRKWYGGFALSVLIGAAIILSWAIPAAISGGPEFAHMLFWGQTADRMVNAFDHARPFYFYFPLVIGFCLPLLFFPSLWRGLKQHGKAEWGAPPAKFLISWIVPTFIAFCFISGKQPHYLLPLLPGVAILAAAAADRAEVKSKDFLIAMLPFVALFFGAALMPAVINHITDDHVSHIKRDGLGTFNPYWFIGGGVVFIAAIYALRGGLQKQALALALGAGILLSIVTLQCHTRIYPVFDLRPLAKAIQPYKDKNLIYARKYDGEIGFLALLDHKIESIERVNLPKWFKDNPDGYAIIRYSKDEQVANYNVLFKQPYQDGKFYALVEPKK